MKRFLTTTAAVAIIAGTAGVAGAQSDNNNQATENQRVAAESDCTVVNRDFEAQLRDNPDMRAGYSTMLTQDVRQLRNAAQILAAYGKDGACQEVADALNELVSNPQEAQRMAEGREPVAGWREEPREYSYEQAQSLDQMGGQLRADRVLGADVRSSNDENIGEISDIILEPSGKPAYAIVTYGGFLGLGEDQSAVPFDKLRVSGDGDVFYLAMTEEQLENAPRFERDTFDWMDDENWRRENDEYYNTAARDAG
ncbi:PRC-barrel domain-containing protein [Microbaculum marinum]|uniref:PRC-barrel domain-containing protein n=1 Tax=Microbaculum marinum TaxID=1764581 RepID=A0AAW9RH02_9HYPH